MANVFVKRITNQTMKENAVCVSNLIVFSAMPSTISNVPNVKVALVWKKESVLFVKKALTRMEHA